MTKPQPLCVVCFKRYQEQGTKLCTDCKIPRRQQ